MMKSSGWSALIAVAFLPLVLGGLGALSADDEVIQALGDSDETESTDTPPVEAATGCEECDTTAGDPVFLQRDYRALVPHQNVCLSSAQPACDRREATPAQLLEGFQAVERAPASTTPYFLAKSHLHVLLGEVEKSVDAQRQAARQTIPENPKEAMRFMQGSIRTMMECRGIQAAIGAVSEDLKDPSLYVCVPAEVIALAPEAGIGRPTL